MDLKAYLELAKDKAVALLADGQVERRHLRDGAITTAKLDSTVYGGTAELADVAGTEGAGASAKVPRADHVHAHGSIATGDLHPEYLTESAHTIGSHDHGGLGGLADDDHTQYLKEKASGGVASETPTHTHADAANCGTVAHSALTGIGAGDHHAQSHGASDHTDVTRRLWLPPEAGAVDDTSSAAANQAGTSPNRTSYHQWADALTSYSIFNVMVPYDWASGAINLYLAVVGTTAFGATDTIRIERTYLHVASSADYTAAGTTTAVSEDPGTGYGTGDLIFLGPYGVGTPAAAGDMLRLTVGRLGNNPNDDYTGNVRFYGLFLEYTAVQ